MNVTAFVLLAVVLLFIGGAFSLIWLRSRSLLREAKNIERGLKMVPMLIHLPPGSDDIDVGGRDARDVTEETISKSQILYDIIASTAKEGFKSRFYGQRHISFEIVASRGLVYYYVAVPVALVDVVQQAVISAYPTARLEQVSEHNIFSPVGKISGTIGGEFNLKEDYVNPIATFQENKRDVMNSILNALANLTNEDGAGIQILLRPAAKGWDKQSQKEVAKRKKEKGGSSGIGIGAKDLASAVWKPPEGKEDKSPESKQLTNLEQSHLDAIEEKTRHAAYEVLIRVVASSNTAHKSQTILNNIVATFALFDAPGKNGFQFAPATDIENFSSAYIMRMFPPEVNGNILNSVELATLFHFPDEQSTPTSQLERQSSKQVDGPRNIPDEGLLMGYNVFRGVKKEVKLSDKDRARHLYIVGQTGTGKSVLLENLALQDMLAGKGFAFVDPHGDAVDSLMNMVPKERTEDIIYFSPGDTDYPLGLNLFEFDRNRPEQKDFLVQEAINMLYKLYDPQHQGIIGPRYEHWFRNASLTIMADPEGASFIDIPKVFTDDAYMKKKLAHVTDQSVLDFWHREMAQTSDYHKSEVLGWFVSKFGAFMSNEMMRNTIGQIKSAFDFREIMDNRKILFVNLAKGKTGELNSKLLGMIFVMKFQVAAMSRADIPEEQRTDFSLYVDEFQNFSTDSFATILSEARKYHLSLVVANQFLTQLTEEIRDAVFGNVGSLVSLRSGANDAESLVKQFSPVFDVEDVINLPNYNAVVRLMIGGVPSQPFSMATIPPLGHPNPELGQALKRLSKAKYGRPKNIVGEEINKRLATPLPAPKPKPRAGAMGGGAQRPALQQPKPGAQKAGAPGGSSFLDEWLAKRKAQGKATPGKAPAKQPVPANSSTAPKPTQASKPQQDDGGMHVPDGELKIDKPKIKPLNRPKVDEDKIGDKGTDFAQMSDKDREFLVDKSKKEGPKKSDQATDQLTDALKEKTDELTQDKPTVKPTPKADKPKPESPKADAPKKKEEEPEKPKAPAGLAVEDEDNNEIYIDKDGNMHFAKEDDKK